MLAGCDLDAKLLAGPTAPASSQPDRRVTSAGIVRIAPEGNPAIDLVHVRVATTNVVADASDAELVVPGHAALHPVAIRGDIATLPFVSLDAPRHGDIDFFFPLGIAPAEATFQWAGISSSLTTRSDLADRDLKWWFDSKLAWSTFRDQDGVITPRAPLTATIVPVSSVDNDAECDDW